MSYLGHISQNVVVDANNSSSTNLIAGAYFIGVPTSTLGVAGIQIAMKTDQNCTIFVQQTPGIVTGDGVITTTAASATITGSASTKFTRDFAVGDQIFIAGESTHYILSITSDTVMTATATFSGVISAPYTFYPWDITDQYAYSTLAPLGITVTAINSYFRVKVNNYSLSATNYFRLQTCLCPIIEALPRSLDENGNLKIASPVDSYGFEVENTPQGESRTISPIRLVGVGFEGAIVDPSFWSTINLNGGTSTQANGRMDLLTNTSANGSTTILSNRKARYIIGSANQFRMQGQFGDTGTIDNVRQFGAGLISNYTLTIGSSAVVAGDIYTDISGVQYTILISGTVTTAHVYATGAPTAGARTYTRISGTGAGTLTGSGFASDSTLTDGYYFQLSGTTFSVVTSIGGTPTPVNSGSFNGAIGASYVPNANMQTWEIYYNTRTVWFVINGRILHTASNPLTPLSNTNSLNAFLKNTNSNGSPANVGLYSRSLSIRRLGLLDTENTSKYITTATTTVCKYGGGRLKKLIIGHQNLNTGAFHIYDGITASSPLICEIQIPKNAAISPQTIEFDLPFHNGLTVVNDVACQCTIIYE